MVASSPTQPLGLRMRNNGRGDQTPELLLSEGGREEHLDRVKVMIGQNESAYSCSDYIGRRSNKEHNSACSSSTSTSADEKMETEMDEMPELVFEQQHDKVDTVCREKMCEWSYRVCDHFQAEREVVAVSFSYLDRFVDKCSCDRSAFKLAAMTTMYMANKIYGGPQRITISSLAELSRGEFEMSHIAEMELIILKTLQWRLHPPTAQCFINSFYNYVSVPHGSISNAIYRRATFFAELSLYDYAFVTKERSLIALASLMNAMEGMDDISLDQQSNFIDVINLTFDLKFTADMVETVRNRLWYIYSMSAQYKEDDAIAPTDLVRNKDKKDTSEVKRISGESSSSPSASPVSVAATVGPHSHHNHHQHPLLR
jgi:hypothetical protein